MMTSRVRRFKYNPDLEEQVKVGEFSEKDLTSHGFLDPEEVSKIEQELAQERRILGQSAVKASQCFIGG